MKSAANTVNTTQSIVVAGFSRTDTSGHERVARDLAAVHGSDQAFRIDALPWRERYAPTARRNTADQPIRSTSVKRQSRNGTGDPDS